MSEKTDFLSAQNVLKSKDSCGVEGDFLQKREAALTEVYGCWRWSDESKTTMTRAGDYPSQQTGWHDAVGEIVRAAFGPGNEDMLKSADLLGAERAFGKHRTEALREGIRIGIEASASLVKEMACGYGHAEKVFANGNLRLAASAIKDIPIDTLTGDAS